MKIPLYLSLLWPKHNHKTSIWSCEWINKVTKIFPYPDLFPCIACPDCSCLDSSAQIYETLHQSFTDRSPAPVLASFPQNRSHPRTQMHTLTQRFRCRIENGCMRPLTGRKAAETAGSLWWGGLRTLAVSGSVCSSPCEGSPAAASSSPPQTWRPADRERGKANRAGKEGEEWVS